MPDDAIIHDEPRPYIVWERRGGQLWPLRVAILTLVKPSALNPFHGNLSGPFPLDEAERIVREGRPV